MTSPTGIDRALRNRLARELPPIIEEVKGTFNHETVEQYYWDAARELSASNVTEFLPALVQRLTRERLKAKADA